LSKEKITGLFIWGICAAVFYLAAVGSWPAGVWLYPAILAIVFAILPIRVSVPLFIAILPFTFPVLRPWSDTLQMWRVLGIVLFISVLVREWPIKLPRPFPRWILASLVFLVISGLSLFVSGFAGLSKFVFLVNGLLVGGAVALFCRGEPVQVPKIVKAVLVTALSILLIGFFQYVFASTRLIFDFWQYWAEVIARNIYGNELANVLWYSNSWFTVAKEGLSIRMFSIMPDSHSFALMCMFGLCALLYLYQTSEGRKLRPYLLGVFGFSLGIVFSGTRGVWAGMLVPLIVFGFLYFRNKPLRKYLASSLAVMLIVILAFVSSPVVKRGLGFVLSGIYGDYFGRVLSIADRNEVSNAGRIAIWKESLEIAVKNPLGVGFGNFLTARLDAESKSKESAEVVNKTYNLPEKYITAHSLFLQILVELGIVGLLVFLWSVLELLKFFYRSLKSLEAAPNKQLYPLLTAIGFGTLWLLGFSVFDVTVFNDKILVIVSVGLGLLTLITEQKKKHA